MKLQETSTLWGNIYKNRYYLDGRRLSDSMASYYLKHYKSEVVHKEKKGSSQYVTVWKIGNALNFR